MKPKTNISIEHRAISETYKYQKKQEAAVSDIADMVQTLYQLLDDNTKVDALKVKQFGAVLMDIRESLNTIKKKDVEFPDFAKPIVEAVSKLDYTLSKVEFKPEIKVDAPQVNVDSPSVDVDLKGVEKILKTEMPKAFKQALSAIPSIEIPEQADRWDEVLEALTGIEVAARLKPQMPTTIKVTNPDGTEISGGGGGGGSSVTWTILNAISNLAYDLDAASFSSTSAISDDYILDSVEFNFSTAESKTITITSAFGTKLYEDTNTNQSVSLTNLNIAFNGGDNFTIAVTTTAGACLMDVVAKIKKGEATLTPSTTYYENRNDTTTDTNLVYLGKALPGSDVTDAAWQIKRYNKSTGHMSFADDVTTFTKQWSGRTTYGY